jgi:hypothetical protein
MIRLCFAVRISSPLRSDSMNHFFHAVHLVSASLRLDERASALYRIEKEVSEMNINAHFADFFFYAVHGL